MAEDKNRGKNLGRIYNNNILEESNDPKMPSGNDPVDELAWIISGAIEDCVSRLLEEKEKNDAKPAQSNASAISRTSVSETLTSIKALLESINDKATAVAMVLYGNEQIKPNTKSSSFASMLKRQPKYGIGADINSLGDSIDDFLRNNKGVAEATTGSSSTYNINVDGKLVDKSLIDSFIRLIEIIKGNDIDYDAFSKISESLASANVIDSDTLSNISNIAESIIRLKSLDGFNIDMSGIGAIVMQITDIANEINNLPVVNTIKLDELAKSAMSLYSAYNSLDTINAKPIDIASLVKSAKQITDIANEINELPVVNTIKLDELAKSVMSLYSAYNSLDTINAKPVDIASLVKSAKQITDIANEINELPVVNTIKLDELAKSVMSLYSAYNSLDTINAKPVDIASLVKSAKQITDIANEINELPVVNTIKLDELAKSVMSLYSAYTNFSTINAKPKPVDVASLVRHIKSTILSMPTLDKSVEEKIQNISGFYVNVDNLYDSLKNMKSSIGKMDGLIKDPGFVVDKNNLSKVDEAVGQIKDLADVVNRFPEINKTNVDNVLGTINALYHQFSKKEKRAIDLEPLKQLNNLLAEPEEGFKLFNTNKGLLRTIIHNIVEASTISEQEGVSSVAGIGEFLNALFSIVKSHDGDDLSKTRYAMKNIVKIISDNETGIVAIINTLKSINEDAINTKQQAKNVDAAIRGIGDLIDSIGEYITIKSYISAYLSLTMVSSIFSLFTNKALPALEAAANKENIGGKISDAIDNLKSFLSIGDSLGDNAEKNASALNNVISAIVKTNLLLSPLAFAAPFAYVSLLVISKEAPLLESIANKINDLEIDDEQNDKLQSLARSIVVLGGITMLAAVAGAYASQHLADMILFGVAIGAFVIEMAAAYRLVGMIAGNKDIEMDLLNFSKLVAISATTMLVGAYIVSNTGITGAALGFGLVLGTFILAVNGAYVLTSRFAKDNEESAEGFAKLVAISAATMVAGGTLLHIFPWLANSMGDFAIVLGEFVIGISAAYLIASFGRVQVAAKEFASLVAISAATMVAGGTLLHVFTWLENDIKSFALILGGFILGISAAYLIASFGRVQVAAKEFSILVAVSAATMLIGGALFEGEEGSRLKDAVVDFALILGGFIFGISAAYAIASYFSKDALKTAIALSLVVGVTGGMLVLAASFMEDGDIANIIAFGIVTIVVVGAMATIAWLISKYAPGIWKGVAALAGLSIVIGIVVFDMILLNEAAKEFDGDKVDNVIERAGVVVIGMAGIAGIIGSYATKVAIGLAGIYAVSELASKVVGIMIYLNEASKEFDANKVDDVLERAAIAIGGMSAIIGALGGLMAAGGGIGALVAGAGAAALYAVLELIGKTINTIVKISKANEAINSLKPVNVDRAKAIILSMGEVTTTILSSDLVMGPVDSYKMGRAASVAKDVASIMGSIAFALKSMADMRLPIYDKNGNITSYVTLVDKDFKKAGKTVAAIVSSVLSALAEEYKKNGKLYDWRLIGGSYISRVIKAAKEIGGIVSSIGHGMKGLENVPFDAIKVGSVVGSIIETVLQAITTSYNAKPELYDWDLGGSPINRVIKATKEIGGIISSIADGVKDVGNINVNAGDIAEKVKNIITPIGEALGDIYNKSNGLYDWTLFGQSRHKKVIDVTKAMIGMIVPIADAVNKIAGMTIPEFDAKGRPTGNSIKMKLTDFQEAGDNIKSVLTAVSGAVNETYKENEDLFDEDDAVNNMIRSMKVSMGIISFAISAVKHFITSGLDPEQFKPNGKYYELIGAIVSALPNAVQNAYDTMNERFKSGNAAESLALFKDFLSAYNDGVLDLVSMYSIAPENTAKYNNVAKGIDSINGSITKIPELKKFNDETVSLGKYIASINSLDTKKVDKFTSLTNALTNMSTQLGGLDKLTKVLAEKMSVVLTNLTDKLEKSADTINKTEKIQEDRHKKINASIEEFKKLLNKPLDVNVKYEAVVSTNPDDTPMGDGLNNYSQGGSPSGGAGGSTPSNNYSPGAGQSINTGGNTQSNNKPAKPSIAEKKFATGAKNNSKKVEDVNTTSHAAKDGTDATTSHKSFEVNSKKDEASYRMVWEISNLVYDERSAADRAMYDMSRGGGVIANAPWNAKHDN